MFLIEKQLKSIVFIAGSNDYSTRRAWCLDYYWSHLPPAPPSNYEAPLGLAWVAFALVLFMVFGGIVLLFAVKYRRGDHSLGGRRGIRRGAGPVIAEMETG